MVAGAVLTFIGTLVPWATGIDQARQPVSFSPAADADGVLFVLVSMAAPVLALSRSVADSRTRTLQAATATLGAVAVLNWLTALRAGSPPMVGGVRVLWLHQPEPGLFVAAAGVGLLASAGLWISVVAWRRNGTHSDPTDVVVTSRMVLSALIQVGLAVAGGIVGLSVPLAAFGPSAILFMTLGVIAMGGIGLAIGARIQSRPTGTSQTSHIAPPRVRRLQSRAWTDGGPRF